MVLMARRQRKVPIRREQGDVMAPTQLHDEGVDGPELHAGPAAPGEDLGRSDMVLAVWGEERQVTRAAPE